MNRQKATELVDKPVMVDIKGTRVEAKLLSAPDRGGNVRVSVNGVERATNISRLYVAKKGRK